jgi:hypothetical protein
MYSNMFRWLPPPLSSAKDHFIGYYIYPWCFCIRCHILLVQMNQQNATVLMNGLLIGSTCFGLSPVHYQEHHLINCIMHWYVRSDESSYCVDVQPCLQNGKLLKLTMEYTRKSYQVESDRVG